MAHPSDMMLSSLASGSLDEAKASAVLNHLDDCTECRAKIGRLSGDQFLKRLRSAHNLNATPAPTKHLPGLPASFDPVETTDYNAIPPELTGLAEYEVIRELGRGGMGVVYQARNKMMGRFEVFKVVNQKLLADSQGTARFLREISSAAQLHHPNIVTAYAALQAGNLLVLVMEYVEGHNLQDVIKGRDQLAVANACHYIRQAALGLQHAFEKGMIHRDIKPGNLILARDGKKHVVKILDFGLAKATHDDAIPQATALKRDLTGMGAIMGTPDYMAPEQAEDAGNVDIRADIYSLGCTFYFLLTGGPPFRGAKNLSQLLIAHGTLDAEPLDKVRKDVPGPLAAIVAKMMAKDPANRYQKPAEIVQALAPFVTGGVKPLPAISGATNSPEGKASDTAVRGGKTQIEGESVIKAAGGKPSRQGTLIEGQRTIERGGGGAGAKWKPNRVVDNLHPPAYFDDQEDRESAARKTLRTPAIILIVISCVFIGIYLVSIVLMRGMEFTPSMLSLFYLFFTVLINVAITLGAGQIIKLRSYPLALAASILAVLPCSGSFLFTLPFGIWLLVLLNKPEIKSAFIGAGAATTEKLLTLRGHSGSVNSASYSPDGSQIITASDDKTAIIWDTATRRKLRILSGHADRVVSASFSPDGKQVVTASHDETAIIWNVDTGEMLLTLKHTDGVHSASYSPDRRQIVTACRDGTAIIWDVVKGEILRTLSGHRDSVNSASYSPDGKQIVSGSSDGFAIVWDAATSEKLLDIKLSGDSRGFHGLASFGSDGKRIVTTYFDKTGVVWDAATGQKRRVLGGHSNTVRSASYSPNGKLIFAARYNKDAVIWDATTGEKLFTLKGHAARVNSGSFSPNGKQIVTASDDKTAIIWETATGQ